MLILFAAIPLASALQIFGYFYLFLTGLHSVRRCDNAAGEQYKDKNAFHHWSLWEVARSGSTTDDMSCSAIPALPQTQKIAGIAAVVKLDTVLRSSRVRVLQIFGHKLQQKFTL